MNTNETVFDEVFKQGLESASTPVPPGVWEGVASSVASSTTTAAVSGVKLALWIKVAISVAVVSTIAISVYQYNKSETISTDTQQAIVVTEQNNVEAEINSNEILEKSEESNSVQVPVLIKEKSNEVKSSANKSGNILNNEKFASPYINNGKAFKIFKSDKNFYNTDPDYTLQKQVETGDRGYSEIVFDEPVQNVIDETPVSNPIPVIVDSSNVEIPNTFTPNGDGINDTYMISLVGEEYFEIFIYDPRTNQILYSSKNKYEGWNSTYPNGELVPAGSYIVRVTYKFKGKKAETIHQRVILIR